VYESEVAAMKRSRYVRLGRRGERMSSGGMNDCEREEDDEDDEDDEEGTDCILSDEEERKSDDFGEEQICCDEKPLIKITFGFPIHSKGDEKSPIVCVSGDATHQSCKNIVRSSSYPKLDRSLIPGVTASKIKGPSATKRPLCA
jgi:hypothetical protein